MRSLVSNISMRGYTYLSDIFKAIDNEQLSYNWLVTGYECYHSGKFSEVFNNKEYCFFSGEELAKIIGEDNISWVKGTFLGFKKDEELEDILSYSIYSDLDEDILLKKSEINTVHPKASIEVLICGASYTVFSSTDKSILDKYSNYFEESKSLDVYVEQIRKERKKVETRRRLKRISDRRLSGIYGKEELIEIFKSEIEILEKEDKNKNKEKIEQLRDGIKISENCIALGDICNKALFKLEYEMR